MIRYLRVRFEAIDGVAKVPTSIRVKLRSEEEATELANWLAGFYRMRAGPVCTRHGWRMPRAVVSVQRDPEQKVPAISFEEAIVAELTKKEGA